MKYRADIQILRGLSVLLVVIYHLQLNIVHSGFLGVDIFFVISGFLMAVLYYPKDHVNQAAFSKPVMRSFYGRRLRRILPAYFVTIAVTLLVGVLWVNNVEYRNLSSDSIFASLLLPNIPYWLQASYFDESNFRPLLHLWSVGVELQFYLIVPLVFALFNRSKLAIILLTLLSLIVCIAVSDRSSNTAFYMLPLRLWEFMFGFLAAKLFTHNGDIKRSSPLPGLGALISIVIISCLNIGFDLNHPGPAALVVCFVTTIVLIYGLPAPLLNSFIGKSFVTLGRYSYSAYLCHYPIILLVYYVPFKGAIYSDQNALKVILIILLTVVTSIAMYHFVEVPLRKQGNRFSKAPILVASSLIFIACAIGLNQFQQKSYSEQQSIIADSVHDRDKFRCGTVFGLVNPFAKSCDLTPSIGNRTHEGNLANRGYLLVGNSHADSIKRALAETAIENGSRLRLWKDNFPLGWGETTVDAVILEAQKHKITTIIIHSSKNTFVVDAVRELIDKASGLDIQVVYIDPVPTWQDSVPSLVWKELTGNQALPIKGLGQHHHENFSELLELNKIVDDKFNNFRRVYTARWLCRPSCQLKTLDAIGQPIYYDSHHLNLTGARLLKPMFETIFNP